MPLTSEFIYEKLSALMIMHLVQIFLLDPSFAIRLAYEFALPAVERLA